MHRAVFFFSLSLTLAMMLRGPAFAQAWAEYVNIDARFGINFPGEPERSERTHRTNSGASFPAEVFTASDAAGTYSVTAVDYSGVSYEFYQTLLDDAAKVVRNRGGEVTYEGFNIYDGMDTISIQVTNDDGSRSFYAITLLPRPSLTERLYIIEGRAAGSWTFSAITFYR